MIFHKWNDIDCNCKTILFIMVNNNYTVDKTQSNLIDFSEFNLDMVNTEYPKDFIDNSSENLLLYLAFSNPTWVPYVPNRTYIFKKNKLYLFGNKWFDELKQEIGEYKDIWYDPFVFVHLKDYDIAMRYLKLNKLNRI